ncbi:MAG: PQQ-dependent sugar dehydrogenase [Pyrinomonadaceae bacterium]
MKNIRAFGGFLFLAVFMVAGVSAQTTPPFRVLLDYITGLSSPVHLTNAKDGTRRMFIVQQRGIIKVVQPGSRTTADFLNLAGVVSSSGGERGLLGLAFHPQYRDNRRFFVYYTRNSDGAIEIAEYAASPTNPNIATPTPVRIIITIPHPTNANHNGGTIAFGPDGYLYAATGDGGSGNDPPNNAQNINVLLGKFIRIDINTPVGQTPAYNIPPTNPYAGATPGLDEIYAIGMRNPYRFSFDRGGTNQLWVGDVGQNLFEEVDIIVNGGNYGWRVYEGNNCTGIDPTRCSTGTNSLIQIPPVFQYDQRIADRCAVTGGYVYRGNQNAIPQGAYLYGDYCSGEILMWHNGQQVPLLDIPRNISSFGEDEDGELYVVGLGGTVDKVLGTETSADFDGDLLTDRSVFRPSSNTWYIYNSSNNGTVIQPFGLSGDIPAAEDFDGDRKADIAVYRPGEGNWYYLRSSDLTFSVQRFGLQGDTPSAGDFDGDGKADLTVFRPSNGTWYTLRSADLGYSEFRFGLNGDVPVASDYDGDGRNEYAVFRPSNSRWYRINTTNGNYFETQHGLAGDIPAPGDFDGDTKTDMTVFRPSTGQWFVRGTLNNSFQQTSWGLNGDVPVVGDYDADGRDDLALFRPSNGFWYVIGSRDGVLPFGQWGLNGDQPVPKFDAP